jgi:hypothetical protein
MKFYFEDLCQSNIGNFFSFIPGICAKFGYYGTDSGWRGLATPPPAIELMYGGELICINAMMGMMHQNV